MATMREKLPTITTALGAVLSLAAALSMRDHVRLVEILTLFFGGVGTGAGIACLVVAGRAARVDAAVTGAHVNDPEVE